VTRRQAIAREAARFGVKGAVHAEDAIFNFVLAHPAFASPAQAVAYYFADGAASARRLLALAGQPAKVLEFAAGFGCVSRHLAREAGLDLVACDIHAAAVEFLHDALGVRAIASDSCPERFATASCFDAVLALSFFSHMPLATWSRWLVQLTRPLVVGGVLVFTTHGCASRPHFGNPELGDVGFWFRPESEQPDLPGSEYGQSITTPDFVRAVIATLPWVRLELWHEADWWGHQDSWVLRKTEPAPP
jgi:hypothetical protein